VRGKSKMSKISPLLGGGQVEGLMLISNLIDPKSPSRNRKSRFVSLSDFLVSSG